ncbi:THO complex subunit 5 [Linnemannia zychae]|nr:THO complex subunit 5 [Linnemannia zychae]
MTAADNKCSENVSRICGELQKLTTQMLELRKTHPRFAQPASPSGTRDDSAMDVDQDEKAKFVLDPTLQKRLQERAIEGHRYLALLKNLNRQIYQQGRNLRNELTEQKLGVGKVDLGYQNIKYQRKYLMNEIARCHDMDTFYQDVPLVSMEEFREMAPENLNNTTDEHQLMLNRLQFELEERKRYDAEKRRLLAVKVQLTKANKTRKAQLNKVETQLETFIQSSQALQDLIQEPIEPIHSHQEILGTVTTHPDMNGNNKTEALGLTGAPSPMVGSPAHSHDHSASDIELIAPMRLGTTELMKRNDVAQLLPQPLYVLFRQACAFSAIFGDEVRAEIQGDVAAAQVEARVLAMAQQTASLPKNTQSGMARAGAVVGSFSIDSPSLQKDVQVEDEEVREKERRGSEQDGQNQYERFPLDVIIKVKKDALASSHTIAHLRFGYLMRLGIVVVAVDSAPGILKLDPSLLLQELFPKDFGDICPNPEAAFLGLTPFDALVSGDGGVGEQGSDLQLDVKKSGGYAYRWAQELCGLEFLGPLSQGWGLSTGTELENLAVDDTAGFSQTVLSGHGNKRAFLSQVIRMIRNRRRAWKSLERQLEDLDRGVIPHLKGKALEYALGMAQPVTNPRHKVTISKWQVATDVSATKGATMYKVQLVMPDPLMSSRSAISAKVIIVEANVEIALSYVDRVPRWELKPGPGFPNTMRSSSNEGTNNSRQRDRDDEDEDKIDMMIDEAGSNAASPAPGKAIPDDESKDRSPFLDSLMYTVNNELPAALYSAEPGERNMLLSVQLTRIMTDLSTVLETMSN